MYQSFAVGSRPGGCRRPEQVGCRWTCQSAEASSGPESCAGFCCGYLQQKEREKRERGSVWAEIQIPILGYEGGNVVSSSIVCVCGAGKDCRGGGVGEGGLPRALAGGRFHWVAHTHTPALCNSFCVVWRCVFFFIFCLFAVHATHSMGLFKFVDFFFSFLFFVLHFICIDVFLKLKMYFAWVKHEVI